MLNALILWSSHVDAAVAFYRAIGVPLEEERHEGGPAHWACDLGGVHMAVYAGAGSGSAPARPQVGATMSGFTVPSLDAAVATAVAAGGRLVIPPEDVPWGRRAVLTDPDGRSVELTQQA